MAGYCVPTNNEENQGINDISFFYRENILIKLSYNMENIVRSWREQKVMLKGRFPELCDADFEFQDGDKESMLANLAAKLNKTQEELKALFAELQLY